MSLRHDLFDRLSLDLIGIRPSLGGFILCPLCLRQFDRTALRRSHADVLTVEHIIPASLDGKVTTLTCKRCNNEHGSTLDAHFVRMTRSEEWMAGDGSQLRGKITLGGVELPMKISWGSAQKPTNMRILGGRESELEAFRNAMRGIREGDKFNISFSLDYKPINARRALLRMGYLILFDFLGYEYVLGRAAAYVRNMIDGANIDQLPRFLFRLRDVNDQGVRTPVVISPVVVNGNIVAYFVLIRIDTKKHRHHGIILPAPQVPEEDVLPLISELGPQLENKRITMAVQMAP